MTDRPRRGKAWTADTEIAFLLALRLTGGIEAACREIGRSPQGARGRRDRYPAFAAKWQAVLDEKHWETIALEKARIAAADRGELEPDAGAMPNRVRYDGFTPLRQRAFLRALASTGTLEKACALAGISKTSVVRMRKKYPSFDAACEAALAKAVPTLEQIAVDRAVNGVTEAVWHGGKLVGHRQRFSDGLMREMLNREGGRIDRTRKSKRELLEEAQAACKRAGGFFSERVATKEELVEALAKRFAALDRRNERQAARAAEEGGSEVEAHGEEVCCEAVMELADGADGGNEAPPDRG